MVFGGCEWYMRIRDKCYFCENVVVCDVLQNDEIIYWVRKFAGRI